MNITIQLPAIFAINERLNKNSIQQLIEPKVLLEVAVEHYQKDRVKGYILTSTKDKNEKVLAICNQARPPDEFNKVLKVKQDNLAEISSELVDWSDQKWIKHPKLLKVPKRRIDYKKRIKAVLESWQGTFSYKTEDKENGLNGLRPPQIGAVHATHAHWTVTDEVATIVMPTGTGKTETMLSILISKRCEKLLVVVPTDALRTQIADKFLTLGILKEFGIVSAKGLYPIVGILKHKPKDCDDVDAFFEKCNVIVTTMQIAGLCNTDIRERMAYHCPFLFIDEAHHTPAQTWKTLKQKFASKKVLQFTATPFRNDGKAVDGKVIFNYPLTKAQNDGYFNTIHFKPIKELDSSKVDQTIAESAVKQLRIDLKKHDHIIMARVGNIKKAEKVLSIYAQYAEFNPVIIHSRMKPKEINKNQGRIIRRESRIVVCVDMFGEGFDLPEMKIAALHDIRKSLAVTLQLAGRFTRTRQDLGDATFIANIADVNVQEKLTKLYYQNANWNVLLKEASEETIQEKIDFQEFVDGFQNPLTDILIKKIRPAMSTVIYKTECKDWKPENFEIGIRGLDDFDRIEHTLNIEKHTLVIVTAKKTPVDWAQSKDIFNWNWELFILFWDIDQNLLFIHSSNNNGYYEKLAEAVTGKVKLIKDEGVFRCFSGIKRLILYNVGLRQQRGKSIGYIMRSGSDVKRGLTEVHTRQSTKSNIFGIGYEKGRKVTIGCSYKGRIWAYRKENINSLIKWCGNVGSKIIDDTLNPDKILDETLEVKILSQRPPKMPIGIEWPEAIYLKPEKIFSFITDGKKIPLFQTDIILVSPSENGDLKFKICSDETNIEFNLMLSDSGYVFSTVENKSISIEQNGKPMSLADFFINEPPKIWFVDGSSLEGNRYIKLKIGPDPYQREKIQTWDWSGTDIKKESQGFMKAKDSIQYRVITELKQKHYDVLFDDDGSGEAADIVCITVRKKKIIIEFYHCKFSLEATPGARIADLYTVCGQAQKSINWMENPTELFDHLLRREALRKNGKMISRFEQGNQDDLWKIKEISRDIPIELKVFIVQPGLSKSNASTAQLELLSVTETYLMETYQIPFEVIAND